MSVFHRKTKVEKVLETLESNEALKQAARRAVESAVSGRGSSRHAVSHVLDALEPARSRRGSRLGRAAKSGLVVGAGLAALTAVSAGVSNMRNRSDSDPSGPGSSVSAGLEQVA
jgi:C4-dicarboxylate-specific signal transduction histidine kinase